MARLMDDGAYSEEKAAIIFKQLVLAVEHLHEHGIAHRDIKPENILLTKRAESSVDPSSSPQLDVTASPMGRRAAGLFIRLSDLGLSAPVRGLDGSPRPLTGRNGTVGYQAPEVLSGRPYDERCDWWSVGVVLYILLVGRFPFFGTDDEIFESSSKAEFDFRPVADDLSNKAKDLITNLLVVDPAKRYTAREILAHPWLRVNGARRTSVSSAQMAGLSQFVARKRFQSGIKAVRSGVMLRNALLNSAHQQTPPSPSSPSSPATRLARGMSISDAPVDMVASLTNEVNQLKEELSWCHQDLEKERNLLKEERAKSKILKEAISQYIKTTGDATQLLLAALK